MSKITKQELEQGFVAEIDDKVGSAQLNTELLRKANFSHTHAIDNVTGLSIELAKKASSSHTHAITNVTGLQAALNAKEDTLAAEAKRKIFVIGLNDALPSSGVSDGDICLRLGV